jgi:hypothetical protein
LNEKRQEDAENGQPRYQIENKPYSIFTHNEKRLIVFTSGMSQFFLWYVMKNGPRWRKERKEKERANKEARRSSKSAVEIK